MAWGELAGLCALGIAEPIFEELQQGLEVFPSLDSRGREAVAFVVAMVAIPPTVLWLLGLLAGVAWPRARRPVHAALVSFLIASMVWQAAHGDALSGSRFATFALIVSFCGALALYLRTAWLPAVTRLLVLAVPVVAISFLTSSPASRLFGPEAVDPPQLRDTPPVVLVVFDELPLATLLGPDGQIDRHLFPNFAQLADDSTWYRNTRTVADQTIHAVPAILSGDYPQKEQIPTRADYPRNIFTLFGGGGSVFGDEVLTDLCPPQMCADRFSIHSRVAQLLRVGSEASVTLPFGIVESISNWLEDETTPPGPGEIGRFNGFINLMRSPPEGGPNLAVIHQLLPHVPWTYLPSGQRYPDPGSLGVVDEAWSGPDYFIKLGFQRHVLQTQFVDHELGQLMSAMKQSGLYDKAVLAVTADHGAAFLPDFSRRGISPVISGWVLPVPAFVKGPGQTSGRVDSSPLRTIDLLPTIARAAGVEIPWKLDGRPPGAPRDPDIDRNYLSFQTGTAKIESSEVDEGLQRAIALRNRFLPGDDPFAVGGSEELIGRPSAVLKTRPLASRLDYPAFDDVYPDASYVNGYASGTLPDFAGEPGDPIAFVLNGRIAATGDVFGEYSEASFATVVPVKFLRPGRNDFQVYPIREASRRDRH